MAIASPLLIDGTDSAQNFPGEPSTLTGQGLTTVHPNDLIIVLIAVEGMAGAAVSTIGDSAGLTWTQRFQGVGASAIDDVEVWWAIAPDALSGDSVGVTLNTGAAPVNATMSIFAIAGADTTSPFDPHIDLPKTKSAVSGLNASVNMGTSKADDMVLGMIVTATAGNGWGAQGAGFNNVAAINRNGPSTDAEYQVVVGTVTSFVVNGELFFSDEHFLIADAIRTAAYVAPFTVGASASASSGNAPLSVQFGASASGGTAPYTYQWNFGDGIGTVAAPGSAPNPIHSYSFSGTYNPIVTVTDSLGNTVQASPGPIVVNLTSPTIAGTTAKIVGTATGTIASAEEGAYNGTSTPFSIPIGGAVWVFIASWAGQAGSQFKTTDDVISVTDSVGNVYSEVKLLFQGGYPAAKLALWVMDNAAAGSNVQLNVNTIADLTDGEDFAFLVLVFSGQGSPSVQSLGLGGSGAVIGGPYEDTISFTQPYVQVVTGVGLIGQITLGPALPFFYPAAGCLLVDGDAGASNLQVNASVGAFSQVQGVGSPATVGGFDGNDAEDGGAWFGAAVTSAPNAVTVLQSANIGGRGRPGPPRILTASAPVSVGVNPAIDLQ